MRTSVGVAFDGARPARGGLPRSRTCAAHIEGFRGHSFASRLTQGIETQEDLMDRKTWA